MGSRKKIRTHSHPKNILWLSWRDVKNPDSGGAEKVAIEVASRFVRNGTNVTIFTSSFKGAKPQEFLREVKIIRRGNRLTCRIFAFLYYLRHQDLDLIIDEINTIPFFSVFYAKDKTIVLIHQLAREYWFTQTIWPANHLGYWLEPFWLKLYKNRPTLALSESTKTDLKKLGFKNVNIYRIGLDFKPQLITKKEDCILFLGRLIPAKGPDQAINAFNIIHKSFPGIKLIITGRGKEKYVEKLKKLSKRHYLQKAIEFKDFVTEKEKINLLKKSKIVLIPSVREGWSLVATEANATSCVPVAYNVPGLSNSIKNNKNGILVPPDYQSLAEGVLYLLRNESKRVQLANFGYKLSHQFSWDNCFADFKNFIFNFANTPPKIEYLGGDEAKKKTYF